MEETKTLVDTNAIKKIREFAEGATCLFCTVENGKIISRPMATQAVDKNGAIWFFSNRASNKNRQLMENATVYLMYIDHDKQQYLSLTGFANIITDDEKVKELWAPGVEVWFPEGENDPDLTLIKVMPEEGHYWDLKKGRLTSMAERYTTGSEGDLQI